MIISPSDKEALKAPDVLHAYCRATLGAGKQVGRLTFYPCPWGAHTRPKMEVVERDGVGLVMCRACDCGGTVYDVAAGVLGLDVRKDFSAVVQDIADKTGYTLRDSSLNMPRNRRRRGKANFLRKGGTSIRLGCPSSASAFLPYVEKPTGVIFAPEYLPPDKEADALEAVKRLRNSPDMLEHWARVLGLPMWILQAHTDETECARLGLLGLDKRGRLLYVYTHTPADGEPVRVVGVKTRNLPGVEPRFLMCGSKQMPWGWDAVDAAGLVFVTEGESDALAVRAGISAWLDDWSHNESDSYPDAKALPVVVGKPDAGTFKEDWAYGLIGKDVVLVADNDDAGRKGAEKTAGILRTAGVRRVFMWTPPAGVKDARAALDATQPWLLVDSLMLHRKELI